MNQIRETIFQVLIIDDTYQHVALYDDVTSLSIQQFWGRGGMAIVTVPEGHDLLSYATLDQLVFIVLTFPTITLPTENYGTTWRIQLRGHIRDSQISTDDMGNVFYLIYISDLLEVLDRYITGYPTGINNKSEWTGAEIAVIADNLVDFNATANGTVAGSRIRDVTVVGGLIGQGAIGGSAVVNYSVEPGRNLLDVLTEIGNIAGFVYKVDTEFAHVGDWDQIGPLTARQTVSTDRSADVIFSLHLDNVSNLNISSDSLREKTVAIIGGKNVGTSRTFAVRTGDNYAANNDKEIWVDAASKEADELDDIGDFALAQRKARISMDAEIFSSLGYVFGRDFFLGDYVSVFLGGVVAVKLIDSVELVFDQGLQPTQRFELVEPT